MNFSQLTAMKAWMVAHRQGQPVESSASHIGFRCIARV